MSDRQDIIAFQLLVAQKRGLRTVRLSGTSMVTDETGRPVVELGEGLSHLTARVKAFAEASKIGRRATLARVALLEADGELALSSMSDLDASSALLPDSKSLSAASIVIWKERTLASMTANMAGTSSPPSSAAALGTIIEHIAGELEEGGELHSLEAIPGLRLEGIRKKWVDVELSALESRSEAFQTPYERGGKRLPVSLFMDGLANAAAIFGDPGAGKTTLLKWIASEAVLGRYQAFRLPIYLRLREYAERYREAPLSIFRFALSRYGVSDPGLDVEKSLERLSQHRKGAYGGVLLLLDGWDEVPPDLRLGIAREIQRTMVRAPCLLTSRPGEMYGLPVVNLVRIEPLSPRLMHKLITAWLPAARAQLVMEHLFEYPDLESLCQNPFILTALCGLANVETNAPSALPRDRRGLYDGVIHAICEHFYGENAPLRLEDQIEFCERLAYHTLADAPGAPRLDFGTSDIKAVGGETELFDKTVVRSRLVVRSAARPLSFAFLHSTIHDFLVARHLKDSTRIDRLRDLMRAYLHSPRWGGVFQSLADQLIDNSPSARDVFLDVLRGALAKKDRFAVTECRVGSYLAALGSRDGGVSLVGEDVAERLWLAVERWPDFIQAVVALARLAPTYLSHKALALREKNAKETDQEKRREQGRLIAVIGDQLYQWRPTIGGPFDRLASPWPEENPEGGVSHTIPKLARRVLDVNDAIAWSELSDSLPTVFPQEQLTRIVLLGESGDDDAAIGLDRFFWQTDSQKARLAVVSALGRMGCPEARDALLSIVAARAGHPEGDLALKALAAYPCPSGVEMLLDIVNDKSARLENRVNAAAALGATADPRVVDLVAAIASSQDHPSAVRVTCLDALASHGNPSHLSALLASAKKRELGKHTSHVTAAIVGIGSRSADRAIFRKVHDVLAEMAGDFLHDPDQTIRAHAIKAAGFAGGRFLIELIAIVRDRAASALDRAAAALALASAASAEDRGALLAATLARSSEGVAALLDLVRDARDRIREGKDGDFGNAGVSALLKLIPKRLNEYDFPEFEGTIARWAQSNTALVFNDHVIMAFEPRSPLSAGDSSSTVLQPPVTTPSATHSPDFTSVNWFGQEYFFAKGNQAKSVQILWEAWKRGGHSLSQETIGEQIESKAERFELAKVFRQKIGNRYQMRPAWGTMIQQVTKGSYRLVPPSGS